MSSSSGRGTSDSVHQANLATFRSFRKTIEELTLKPRTVLGDHASLVKRIQDWRKTVSALTVWVTDDRAYYQQARPEIVSMLEAVFDSVRAVDTVRSQIPEPNWVRASEKEFEYLLQDYIKLIEIAFPPHRQSRYNTPADQDPLNRGKILYNGLYSFRRRLGEVRGIPMEQRRGSTSQSAQDSIPPQQQQQQHMSAVPANFQTIPAPPRTASQGYADQGGVEVPHMRPYTQPDNAVRTSSLPADNMVLVRPIINSNHTTPQAISGMQLPQLPHLSAPSQTKSQVETQGTLTKQSATPPIMQPVTDAVLVPASDTIPGALLSEEQDWDLNLNWDELEALDRSEWQGEDSIQAESHDAHLEDLPKPGSANAPETQAVPVNDQDTPAGPNIGESGGPSIARRRNSCPYSDDEMEVDELDPSEPTGSIRQSEQPDDNPTGSFGQIKPTKPQTFQPSSVSYPVSVVNHQTQLVASSSPLPPHIRADIRQKAKEPLIAHYLSIQPSETRDAVEKRFDQMSDQEIGTIEPQNTPPTYRCAGAPKEPPTLLCSVTGAMRLSSETVEFSISPAIMASLERWRARFVTPAGSHGDLITVELACYSKDAFHSPEGKGLHELTPNAQTRTWPDGGILWAFINAEDEVKDRNVRLFLSPPPFIEPNQSVDISDFIREGHNTVKFVHLGGMEHFTFVVQTRRMPPPYSTWPGVLKRIQSLDPSSANGYSALINRISAMLEEN
ncbi:hypothetical protein RHS01_06994 [Rhizoctonia solani]|uniref:Uncharacterized protein n=1 Tax=Rhizoctonia solani TaxID=456999 RepID=A0A8H7IA33_9AGAM|nr:hypothetical protein RHS01_06994 [Rhizoctonia solani]